MRPFTLFLFLSYSCFSIAQNTKAYHFALINTQSKFLFKSQEYNNIAVPNFQIWELNISTENTHASSWRRHYNFPEVGLSMAYTNFDAQPSLGYLASLITYIEFPLLRQKKLYSYFYFGTGLAYLEKPYHIKHNPNNKAIGSHLNNNTRLAFGIEYQITPHINLVSRACFNHISVGMLDLPNWGLDIPGISLGLSYKKGHKNADNYTCSLEDSIQGSLFLKTRMGIVSKEVYHINGPAYPVYLFSLQLGKYLTSWNKLMVGINISENKVIEAFSESLDINGRYALLNNSPISIELGDELLFSNVGLSGQIGCYLHYPYLKPAPLYTRLGLQYYFAKHLAYIGINLKAHNARADYIEWCIGFQLHKKRNK